MTSEYPPADNSNKMLEASGRTVRTSPLVSSPFKGFPARELLYTIDPVRWAQAEFGLTLDDWQKGYLYSPSKRKSLNCCRQSGKSTVAAVKALHRVVHKEKALVLLLSPSLRQSSELFRKVSSLYDSLPSRPKLLEDNRLSMALRGGSRIVSLPSSEATIRGYSNVDLIIEDEAAAVPDELHAAVLPMLAVSNGEIDLLSTPRGRLGHFAEAWASEDWERTLVRCEQVPRISRGFLEDMRMRLGSRMFAQEFECEFLDIAGAGMFRREWFDIVDDYPRRARSVRYWDKAATSGGGDFTAGVRMVEDQGAFYIVDVRHAQNTPGQNEALVKQTAQLDGVLVKVRMEQEPGSAGVDTIDRYQRIVLQGYDFKGVRSTGSKVERAGAFSAACEAGNVKLVRGAWNVALLDELVSFPEGEHDDQADGCSGAFNALVERPIADPNRFLSYSGKVRR
jgi:predicted phage terminase large subunit-like protein